MNRLKLIQRSLSYFWKTNLALLLGLMAGTAVITGALIVGDSVRHSLIETSLGRLGKVDVTLHTPRFFREELATEISGAGDDDKTVTAAPLIALNTSLVREEDEQRTGLSLVQTR